MPQEIAMSNALDAQTFAKAVQQAETEKKPDTLVKLFADDASIEAPVREQGEHGTAGAHAFWKQYLDLFQSIRSNFTRIHTAGDTGVLEWESTGNLKSGWPITYKGVSIVEFAGGKVKRFATYYDSAAFLTEGSKHAR
jgi:ketosteroid isomerase-like protein